MQKQSKNWPGVQYPLKVKIQSRISSYFILLIFIIGFLCPFTIHKSWLIWWKTYAYLLLFTLRPWKIALQNSIKYSFHLNCVRAIHWLYTFQSALCLIQDNQAFTVSEFIMDIIRCSGLPASGNWNQMLCVMVWKSESTLQQG